MHVRLRHAALLGIGLAAAVPQAAYAQVMLAAAKKDPELRCYARQAKHLAKLCKRTFACRSRRWKAPAKDSSGAIAAACEAAAVASFGLRYDRALQKAAESGASCVFSDPFTAVAATVSGPADAIETGVLAGADPNDPPDIKLRSKLLKQAGAMCARALRAEGKDARKRNDARLAESRLKTHEKLETSAGKAIARAALKGVTYARSAPDAIADDVDAIADGFAAVARPPRFIISGSVVAAESAFVDRDVNDPKAKYKTNDNVPAAQKIPVPSTCSQTASASGSTPRSRRPSSPRPPRTRPTSPPSRVVCWRP